MQQNQSNTFINALKNANSTKLMDIPKGDLHCHCPLSFKIVELENLGVNVSDNLPFKFTFNDFEDYITKNLTPYFKNKYIFEYLCFKCVDRAVQDGITLLCMILSVAHRKKYNSLDDFFSFIIRLKNYRAEHITTHIDIGLRSEYGAFYFNSFIEDFIKSGIFSGIDLSGIESTKDKFEFSSIYNLAKTYGLKLKAHLGESLDAKNLIETASALKLDEINHGIAFSQSDEYLFFLKENNIRLHISPISNIRLGYIKDYYSHPIVKLIREGIRTTIGTDDVTIFDTSLTKSYLDCYKFTNLTALELDSIRKESLRY